MKIGDKIYCKRSLHQYQKGEYYTITYIDLGGYIFVPYADGEGEEFDFMYNTFHTKKNQNIKYDCSYFYNHEIYIFNDYFRSIREERKLKILKILNSL